MAQNPEPQRNPEHSELQLRALISLFNWLVGEVVTARIMILRLAADLVRTGGIAVDDINGSPLAEEIIDSVLSNFPSDPMWQPLAQRLRASLESIRRHDLEEHAGIPPDLLDEDLLEDEDGLDPDLLDEDDLAVEAQVIYRAKEEHHSDPLDGVFPRLSRSPNRGQN